MADAHTLEDVQKHVRTYLIIFGSLMVLTIVTVAVAYLQLSIWPALIIGLLIALTKGGLVAGYFMHLLGEKPMIRWILILTAFFLIFMFIIFVSAYHNQQDLAIMGGLNHVS
jgi:cytochrome c oxidase subunit IV